MKRPSKPCAHCGNIIPDDDTNYRKKKYCNRACYRQGTKTTPELLAARFWAKVDKRDGCWIWKGARSLSRYGTFNWYGSNINAHRAAWMLTHGPIEGKGIDVLHRCNNGHLGCVTPHHLYLGTDKENVRDRIEAGTMPRGLFERRLKPDAVRAIRALKGKVSSSEAGKQFGLTYRAVQKIWARHVYKNID